MNELEPNAKSTQWLWFGAALAAMTVIALVVSFPRAESEVEIGKFCARFSPSDPCALP
jgi:hypothetical protein